MNRRLSKLRPSCHLAVKYRNSSILTHPFRTGGIVGLICHQPETLVPGKPYITDTHIDEPVTLDLLDTQQNEIYLQPKEIYFTTKGNIFYNQRKYILQPNKFKLIYTQGQTLLQL